MPAPALTHEFDGPSVGALVGLRPPLGPLARDHPEPATGSPGLPPYRRDNQRRVSRDIVLRLTLGHHHVTQAEDWPVRPMQCMGCELRRVPFEVLRRPEAQTDGTGR